MLNAYIASLRNEKKSERTIKEYTNYVNKMHNFINKPDTEITYLDLCEWANTFSHLAPASIRLAYNGVKSYFNFLENAEIITKNPAVKLKAPSIKNKEKEHMSKEDVSKLMTYATTYKAKAIISTLASTGVRFSELAGITLDDYNKAMASNRQIVITGKGSQQRSIYINQNTQEMIDIMIGARPVDSCDKLFVNSFGGELKESSVNKMLKNTARKAGFSYWNDITPHWLRAAFATIADDNGVPVGVISKAMGHKSINTTSVYIKASQKQINNVSMSMEF